MGHYAKPKPILSLVLPVKKVNSIWRMYINYRALNHENIKDNFFIPIINELLDELHNAKILFNLNLRSSYHQIRIKYQDIPKIIFRTHESYYEFVVWIY